ncbi:MAG: hypothetical protein O9301_09015 [Leptospira sp.]|nr:hypothetical protein [Leptospira sp.]
MAEKSLVKNEFHVKCPLYAKGLSVCPSSKDRLLDQDMDKLLSHCVKDSFIVCESYTSRKQKEQAA